MFVLLFVDSAIRLGARNTSPVTVCGTMDRRT